MNSEDENQSYAHARICSDYCGCSSMVASYTLGSLGRRGQARIQKSPEHTEHIIHDLNAMQWTHGPQFVIGDHR